MKTNNSYIMFIDTGDIFISKEIQKEITRAIYVDPNIDIFSFQYYHYGELAKEADNRLHGKVYKRSFLIEHDISFCAESSYMNEDIGFNRTCRYLTDIESINIPIIEQIYDEQSLTQKDNCITLYRD